MLETTKNHALKVDLLIVFIPHEVNWLNKLNFSVIIGRKSDNS